MESMREMFRKNLGRSLEALPELDRLTAAWPVACGKAMAGRGEIVGYADGTVEIAVQDTVWLDQMRSMRAVLERELAKISGVKVAAIHFELKKPKLERMR